MNPILAYFDLNNRTSPVIAEPITSPNVNSKTLAPFGKIRRRTATSASSMSLGQQVVFYLGTVVGVFFSSAIMQFQAGKTATVSVTAISIVLAAIIALVIMPFVYKKGIEPEAPFIIQLGVFVQSGVFWSVVFTLIGKAYG